MLYFANLFLDIALLRRPPQDVPASRFLQYLTVAAVILSYVLAISPQFPLGESLGRAVVDVVFLALFVYALLAWFKRPVRFNQAFTALCGTSTILNLLTWPLLNLVGGQSGGGSVFGAFAVLLLWVMMFWSVLITAHVFRHAVERDLMQGTALAILYMIGAYAASKLFFPD